MVCHFEHSEKSHRDPSSLRSVGMIFLGTQEKFHSPKIQYFLVSTPVLSRKYSSTWP